MLRTPKPPGRARGPAVIGSVSLALILAACGSVNQDALQTGDPALVVEDESTDVTETSVSSVPEASEAAVGSLVDPAVSETPEPTTPTTTPTIATTPTTAPPTTTTTAPTTAPPAANNFPAVAVQRISDGAEVDAAAQLAGGNLPVLLWFWSPF
ncbi:MAG: hypothetical protein AAF962_05210 [Actinomycetota bacterium]